MNARLLMPILAGAVLCATPAAAQADMVWLGSSLSGVFVPRGGDSDGFGRMMMQVDTDTNRVCYTLMASKIALATTARLQTLACA